MNFDTLVTWSNSQDNENLKMVGGVKELYGYSFKEFQENRELWYDVIHPEDRRYLDLAVSSLDDENIGEVSIQYRIVHKSGKIKTVIGTIKSDDRKLNTFYSGYLVDITKHKEVMLTEGYSDDLLDLFEESVKTLYQTNDSRDAKVNTILHRLGKTIKVDRIYVYTNTTLATLSEDIYELTLTSKYEKNKYIEEDDFQNKTKINLKNDMPTIFQSLVQDKTTYQELIRLMPNEEKQYLNSPCSKSILAVPIYFDNKFKGFIRFDECKQERYWGRKDINILKSYGTVIYTSSVYEKYKELVEEKIRQLQQMRDDREQGLKMLSHEFKTPLSIVELNIKMIESIKDSLPEGKLQLFEKKINRIQRSILKMKDLIETILG